MFAQRKVLVTVAIGLVVLAVLLGACSGGEKAATPAPTKAAATQVVGSGATPTQAAAGAAAPGAQPASATWPNKPANLPILGAITNEPPRATPTPLPAGVTATPPPAPPTPKAAAKQQVLFYVDTVTSGPGESPFNVGSNLNCVRSSSFARGMHVVWRVMAFDNTGVEIQPASSDTFVLKLPTGTTANFRYGRHGATDDSPWFWTATWDVPLDYPIGAVDYAIELKTKSGLSGTFKDLAVDTSKLQIVR